MHSLRWTSKAEKDYRGFERNNPRIAKKILELLRAIQKNPYGGIGKPEPLKHELTGCWSRRIDNEHRLVYRIDSDEITILQCRYHY